MENYLANSCKVKNVPTLELNNFVFRYTSKRNEGICLQKVHTRKFIASLFMIIKYC